MTEPDTPTDSDLQGSADVNRQLQGLTHPVRRDVVRVLIHKDRSEVTFDDLLADLSHPSDIPGCEQSDIPEFRGALRHRHLPTLEKRGVITYDSANNTIVYTGGSLVKELLEVIDRNSEEGSVQQ